jgi:hypothetical protein
MVASFGAEANLDTLVVYEAIAANQMPLRRNRGLYKGARFTPGMMREMAAAVAAESVPLQLQHNTEPLPVGRVFAAEVYDDELRTLFAVNQETQPALISDLDAGVVDQVSVGILPSRLLCSECGWDYMGEGATFENFWTHTCANGHTVGEDAVFVWMAALETFMEQSLVGKGAVRGPKIVAPSESQFAKSTTVRRLAASAEQAGLFVCSGIPEPSRKENKNVDMEKFLAQLTASASEAATAKAQLAVLTAQLGDREATIATLQARVTELETAAAAPNSDVETAVAVLTEIATRSAVALGEQTPAVPKTVSELQAFIAERQAKLTAVLPTKARSEPAENAPGQAGPTLSAAFVTRK